jgi:hypothetical protein
MYYLSERCSLFFWWTCFESLLQFLHYISWYLAQVIPHSLQYITPVPLPPRTPSLPLPGPLATVVAPVRGAVSSSREPWWGQRWDQETRHSMGHVGVGAWWLGMGRGDRSTLDRDDLLASNACYLGVRLFRGGRLTRGCMLIRGGN